MEQGWGLTTMGDKLVMSDGSHNLYHLDPNLFSVVKTVEVFDNKGPVTNLNELEYINGYTPYMVNNKVQYKIVLGMFLRTIFIIYR